MGGMPKGLNPPPSVVPKQAPAKKPIDDLDEDLDGLIDM